MEAGSAKHLQTSGPRASPQAIRSLVHRWGIHEGDIECSSLSSPSLHSSMTGNLWREQQKAWQHRPDARGSWRSYTPSQPSDILSQERSGIFSQERSGLESSLHVDNERAILGRTLLEKLEGLPEALNMAKDALVEESVRVQTELREFIDRFELRIASRLDKHEAKSGRFEGRQQGNISQVLKDVEIQTDKIAETQGIGAMLFGEYPEILGNRCDALLEFMPGPTSPLSLHSIANGSSGGESAQSMTASIVASIVVESASQKRAMRPTNRWTRIVDSDAFHFAAASAIIVNTAILGVQTDIEVRNAMGSRGSDYVWFHFSNLGFLVFFSAELLLRILAEQMTFVTGEHKVWNLLDTLLVGTAIVEEFAVDMGINFTNFRVIRVIRMLKTMRVLRLFAAFRDLRLMVTSLFLSLKSLTWAMLLMTLLIFCCAVLFCQGVTAFAESDLSRNTRFDVELQEFYGSLSKTMFTLIMAISGGKDWYDLIVPLGEVSYAYAGIFVIYILFVMFGMLNVLTGVFCDRASELSHLDRDLLVESEKFQAERTRESLKAVFREADTDNSGNISWKEFKEFAERPDVQQFFSTMDLPIEETKEIFHMFDQEQKGKVDIDLFVNGCMRLKGHAKNLDILHMIEALEDMKKKVTHVDQSLTLLVSNGARTELFRPGNRTTL